MRGALLLVENTVKTQARGPAGYAGDWEQRGGRREQAGVSQGLGLFDPCTAHSLPGAHRKDPSSQGAGAGLTLNQLPLAPDDALAQQPVLVEALDDEVLLAQQVLPAQAAGLQLGVLHLQLVHPAQQPQHLPLVLADGLRGQQLLQLRGLLLGAGQALLQLCLADRPGAQGRGPGSLLPRPLIPTGSGLHTELADTRGDRL